MPTRTTRRSEFDDAPGRLSWGPIARIVLPYLALGALWILFSDRILLSLVDNPQELLAISTGKGWLYVLLTSVLLFVLLYRELRRQFSLESQLREGLREKSALLFELNHRVKNNLQVISSLLSLEGGSFEGDEARALGQRMLARVRAMALAHESSAERGGIDQIELGSYLAALWPALAEIFKAERAKAALALEELYAHSDDALSFGLFATEAMAEILRGLDPDTSPEAAISLSAAGAGMAEFRIRSEIPAPRGVEARLGEDLMAVLAQQLRGKLERKVEEGAGSLRIGIRLLFPLSEKAAHA